jgi:Tol biopolymer transport system component
MMSVYSKASDGSGLSEEFFALSKLGADAGQVTPFGFSADERDLLVVYTDADGPNLASIRDGDLNVILATSAIENTPTLSPNGKWLAYISDETGEMQVFVRAFSGTGGKWQVSATGGNRPRWAPDGTELFFRKDETLQVVTVKEDGDGFSTDRPQIVFEDLDPISAGYDYDVFDSNRFLFTKEVGNDDAPAGVTVVINWLDEVEQRVPRQP